MSTALVSSDIESAILNRIIDPQQGRWPPEAARAILTLSLAPEDRERMNELAAKAVAGSLSIDEELEIEGYRHICRTLDLLKARARVSLAQPSSSAGPRA